MLRVLRSILERLGRESAHTTGDPLTRVANDELLRPAARWRPRWRKPKSPLHLPKDVAMGLYPPLICPRRTRGREAATRRLPRTTSRRLRRRRILAVHLVQ